MIIEILHNTLVFFGFVTEVSTWDVVECDLYLSNDIERMDLTLDAPSSSGATEASPIQPVTASKNMQVAPWAIAFCETIHEMVYPRRWIGSRCEVQTNIACYAL